MVGAGIVAAAVREGVLEVAVPEVAPEVDHEVAWAHREGGNPVVGQEVPLEVGGP